MVLPIGLWARWAVLHWVRFAQSWPLISRCPCVSPYAVRIPPAPCSRVVSPAPLWRPPVNSGVNPSVFASSLRGLAPVAPNPDLSGKCLFSHPHCPHAPRGEGKGASPQFGTKGFDEACAVSHPITAVALSRCSSNGPITCTRLPSAVNASYTSPSSAITSMPLPSSSSVTASTSVSLVRSEPSFATTIAAT